MILISNMKQKFKAPALARGLDVLLLLSNSGSLSLEKLSLASRIPKASLLRILQTLELKGLVERDPIDKHYTNKVFFFSASASKDFMLSLPPFLKNLSMKTDRTVEFYSPERESLKITARSECGSRMITVKANLGFRRELDGELEAVARIGHVFGSFSNCKFSKKLWQYKNGKKKKITISQYKEQIEKVKSEKIAFDIEFNSNGVRRSAAPIFQNGKFAGVIALAENFFPNCDKETIKNLKILKYECIAFSKNT